MRNNSPSRKVALASAILFALLAAACSGAAAQTVTPTPPAAPATSTHVHTTGPSAVVPAAAATAATTQASAPLATTVVAAAATAGAVAPAPTVAPAVAPQATAPAATPAPSVQAAASGSIAVTLGDIAIKLDRTSSAAGKVTFAVKNAGTVIHQLVVLKTDLAQNQIPVDPSQPGKVTEPGLVAQTPTLSPGASTTLTLTLGAGNYVLMCNEPAHYLIGMHIGFTIN